LWLLMRIFVVVNTGAFLDVPPLLEVGILPCVLYIGAIWKNANAYKRNHHAISYCHIAPLSARSANYAQGSYVYRFFRWDEYFNCRCQKTIHFDTKRY